MTLNEIKAAKPGDEIFDKVVRGLHLRVAGSGRRAFYLRYKTRAGRKRRPKIGEFPHVSLTDARRIAGRWLTVVADGGDPYGGFREQRDAPTMNDLCDQYMKWNEKKTAAEESRLIERHIRPRFGKLKVQDVTAELVDDMRNDMRSTPYQSNRTLALLSFMMKQASRWGMRPAHEPNPVSGVMRYKERNRVRYATDDELRKIVAILKRDRETHASPVAFIELMLWTGARKSEIANARWEDINGHRIVLREHKTDRTGFDRVVQLTPPAMEVLKRLQSRPRVPGDTIVRIRDPKRYWDRVREEIGSPDLRMYDLRHTFASMALATGTSLAQIGELLGHRSAQTTKRYAHLQDEIAADAAEATAGRIQALGAAFD